ncbi:MAG: hypothetical protein N2044_12815 [Cyclobacteriaceae bacterium]|nr:hypothetical protein [Cyclobacteriaceae bacterium]
MKYLFVVLLSIFSLQVIAQEESEKDPKARQRIEAARIAFITERLGLTPEEAERFWPVYREFVQKRMELRKQFELQRKIQGNNPSEEQQRKLVEMDLQLKQQELDLEKEYSGRLLQAVPPQKLLALRQAEADFRAMVLRQIQQRQFQQQRQQRLQERNEQRLRQRNN